MKRVLANTQGLRTAMGMLQTVLLISATSSIVKHMKDTAVNYFNVTKAAGPRHEYGPPNPHIFFGMMKGLDELYQNGPVKNFQRYLRIQAFTLAVSCQTI